MVADSRDVRGLYLRRRVIPRSKRERSDGKSYETLTWSFELGAFVFCFIGRLGRWTEKSKVQSSKITAHFGIGNLKFRGGTMSNVPEDLHYSKDHEWVRVEGDVAVVGITDYAQNSLGDVVYVELPKAGEEFAANESFGSVESVKAVSEVFSPVSGKVAEVNDALNDEPEKVNADPYGDGWMIKVRMSSPGEVDSLLTAAEYEDFTKAETE